MREYKFRVWNNNNFFYIDFKLGINPWVEALFNNPDSIFQQFTGILDSKGKEIYEGDILKWDKHILTGGYNTHNFEVVYHQSNFNNKELSGFILEIIGDKRPFVQVCGSTAPRELEIIGNIFENPELLNET